MSAVIILVPVVSAAWPVFAGAAVAAAGSLGWSVAEELAQEVNPTVGAGRIAAVNLRIPNSEVVTGQLGRDQRIVFTRDGVTVAFSRDEHGKAAVCVTGPGRTEEDLQSLGKELSQRVVQRYVHQRLLDEMRARQCMVVEESMEGGAIHLKVRQWEN